MSMDRRQFIKEATAISLAPAVLTGMGAGLLISESDGTKRYVLSCIQADVPTVNGRIYPHSVLEKAIEGAQERVNKGFFIVHRVPPEDGKSHLHHACGIVKKLELNTEGFITCDVYPLKLDLDYQMMDFVDQGSHDLFTVGIGDYEDDNIISSFEITSLFVSEKIV